jgi:hypothetical protein
MSNKIETANSGTYSITTLTPSTLECVRIFVGADTVLDNLEVDGVAVDVRTTYIDDAAGTFYAGTMISPRPPHKKFTNVQIASGSITQIF